MGGSFGRRAKSAGSGADPLPGPAFPDWTLPGGNASVPRPPGLTMSKAASTSGWMMPNWPTGWPRNSTDAWRPGKKVGSSCRHEG